MNAIQYIKDNGIQQARKVVDGAPKSAELYNNGKYIKDAVSECEIYFSIQLYESGSWINEKTHKSFIGKAVDLFELERLVKSQSLVVQFGNDLDGAKQLLNFSKGSAIIKLNGNEVTLERFEQAVKDAEMIHN